MGSGVPFDPCASQEVASYVRGLAGAGPPLETRIHPSDEMHRFELEKPKRTPDTAAILYFATAAEIFRTVSEVVAWRFGGFGAVRSFLDFASGYGRSTRFFARALDPARITVAEIDPGAVRFQEQAFGVRGRASGASPEALGLAGPFDVVLAASFFSHLPAGRFEAWLARLHALVAEGGVLAFSTHGPDLLPEGERMPPAGIAFRPESETTRLGGAEYGTSWVDAEFVRGAVRRLGGGARLFEFPYGFCGFQDLYVVARPPLPAGELRLARPPRGALQAAAIERGVVSARGWAEGDRDERPPDMRLWLGDRVEAESPGTGAPGTRRDWSFSFGVSAVPPDRVVRIEAVSARGVARPLVVETLRPHLPRM
jgi:SAM-dependent methyltransferase